MSVREIVILPVEWAPYCLGAPPPFQTYLCMQQLIAVMSGAEKDKFNYLLEWYMVASYLNETDNEWTSQVHTTWEAIIMNRNI